MASVPAIERALSVLNGNRYFALSTLDADGPWTCALAYVPAAPNRLLFRSNTSSRHAKAIVHGCKISGLIYDSSLPPEQAESIQFSGTAGVAHGPEHSNAVQALTRDGVPEPPTSETVMFYASMDEAYVLDQQTFLLTGIDTRERFDAPALFSLILGL